MQQDNMDEAKTYLGQLCNQMSHLKRSIKTGNLIVDAILNDKLSQASERDIKMKIEVDGEKIAFLKEIDICTIYGNLIDNALEACSKACQQQSADRPYIHVKTMQIKGITVIEIINTYAGPVVEEKGRLLTTKQDTLLHGIGLSNVRHVVEAYEGELHIAYDSQLFKAQVIF